MADGRLQIGDVRWQMSDHGPRTHGPRLGGSLALQWSTGHGRTDHGLLHLSSAICHLLSSIYYMILNASTSTQRR